MNDALSVLNYQPPADAPLKGWGIVRWWEYRRLFFNGLIFLVGVVVLIAIGLIAALDKQDTLGSPLLVWVGVIFYAIAANVCYTGGLILDLAWTEPDRDAAARRRRGIFRAGLIFSCLVTTVPLWIAFAALIIHHL